MHILPLTLTGLSLSAVDLRGIKIHTFWDLPMETPEDYLAIDVGEVETNFFSQKFVINTTRGSGWSPAVPTHPSFLDSC